jgi:hypothetical protein
MAAVGRCCFRRASRIDIESTGKQGAFRLMNDAQMITAEGACADDCDSWKSVNSGTFLLGR